MRDFDVGLALQTSYSGYKIHAIALYDRYLTDNEMVVAYNALRRRAKNSSIQVPAQSPERIVFFLGDSITAGQAGSAAGPGYAYLAARTASPTIRGIDYGVAGSTVAAWSSTWLPAVQAQIQAAVQAPNTHVIVHIGLGTNDLAGASPSGSAFLTALQTFIGVVKALGPSGAIKIVVPTLMSRTDQSPGSSNTAFDVQRDTVVNPGIRACVGTVIDACADFASDGTMGPDGASSNTTNFVAGLHPTSAGHALLAPYAVTALNGV